MTFKNVEIRVWDLVTNLLHLRTKCFFLSHRVFHGLKHWKQLWNIFFSHRPRPSYARYRLSKMIFLLFDIHLICTLICEALNCIRHLKLALLTQLSLICVLASTIALLKQVLNDKKRFVLKNTYVFCFAREWKLNLKRVEFMPRAKFVRDGTRAKKSCFVTNFDFRPIIKFEKRFRKI